MKLSKKIIALTAAALAICMSLASCSAQKEDNGIAYEKNMKISTAEDLADKAVAVQLRSAVDDYVVTSKLTGYPKRYSDMKTAVQDLIDKKVAAVVVDSNYAKQLTDGVEGVQIVKKSVGSIDYRFLLNKSDSKLAEKMNTEIAAFKKSEEYQTTIDIELVNESRYLPETVEAEKDAKKTLTFVTEPSFRPFIYEVSGSLKGFFLDVAYSVASSAGYELDVKTVDVSYDIDNAADTVKGEKKSFSVVAYEAAEDDESFITTDSFYTSELVMIIRTEEKK